MRFLIWSSASYTTRVATDFLPSCIRQLMNLLSKSEPYRVSGASFE